MTILGVILYTAVILVSLLLIALVLVQQSKGGGLGGAFGGIGESVFGGQVGNHLSKLTVILSVVFFVLIIFLAFSINKDWIMKHEDSKIIEEVIAEESVEVEAPVAVTTPAEQKDNSK